MEMERALDFDYFEQIKNSDAKRDLAVHQREAADDLLGGIMGPMLPTHGIVLRWVHLPFWRVAWADQEVVFVLNQWDFPIEQEKLARSRSWAALSSKSTSEGDNEPLNFLGPKEEMDWYDRLRFPFATEGFPINDNEIRRAICAQAQQRMAVTAIAIHRYRLQTGKFPDELATLVPKFLPALPRDDMDGKTLRYKLRPDGGFLLYSVGLDGKDDGGDSAPANNKKHVTQIWDCRDAVWPAPATDEEALAAMKAARN
jgi:hypothetical protein